MAKTFSRLEEVTSTYQLRVSIGTRPLSCPHAVERSIEGRSDRIWAALVCGLPRLAPPKCAGRRRSILGDQAYGRGRVARRGAEARGYQRHKPATIPTSRYPRNR